MLSSIAITKWSSWETFFTHQLLLGKYQIQCQTQSYLKRSWAPIQSNLLIRSMERVTDATTYRHTPTRIMFNNIFCLLQTSITLLDLFQSQLSQQDPFWQFRFKTLGTICMLKSQEGLQWSVLDFLTLFLYILFSGKVTHSLFSIHLVLNSTITARYHATQYIMDPAWTPWGP